MTLHQLVWNFWWCCWRNRNILRWVLWCAFLRCSRWCFARRCWWLPPAGQIPFEVSLFLLGRWVFPGGVVIMPWYHYWCYLVDWLAWWKWSLPWWCSSSPHHWRQVWGIHGVLLMRWSLREQPFGPFAPPFCSLFPWSVAQGWCQGALPPWLGSPFDERMSQWPMCSSLGDCCRIIAVKNLVLWMLSIA